jgi:DNA-binding transcriptional LysR family regulator
LTVESQITTNDMLLMVRTALAGGGITIGMEETFRLYIASGQLVPVLTDHLPTFAGFYLYFPNRRNQPPKLRALVDHVQSFREKLRRADRQ